MKTFLEQLLSARPGDYVKRGNTVAPGILPGKERGGRWRIRQRGAGEERRRGQSASSEVATRAPDQ